MAKCGENIIASENLGTILRYANSKLSRKFSVGPIMDARFSIVRIFSISKQYKLLYVPYIASESDACCSKHIGNFVHITDVLLV